MRSREVFALAAALAFGCSRAEPATQERTYAAVHHPTAEGHSPLVVRLRIEARAATDSAAVLRLELVNTGDTAVSLLLTDRPPAFDLKVARADGSVVWRRLRTRFVRTVGTRIRLRSGESRTFSERWGLTDLQANPVRPGTYYVQGLIYTDQGLSWTTPQPLVVGAVR